MKPKPKRTVKTWAPEVIYLTRDGYNDTLPDDGEILWCQDRITKKDVAYKRVDRILPKGRGR